MQKENLMSPTLRKYGPVLTTATALVLTGCATVHETEKPPGKLPDHGAPKVLHPISTSYFKAHPCNSLTTDQIETLGLEEHGKPDDVSGGPTCTWNGPHDAAVHLFFIPKSGGLSDLYADKRKYHRFEPQPPINGYPSVISNLDTGQEKQGSCSYSVGMNDRDVVNILVLVAPGSDPCEDAKSVARGVTKTMTEKAIPRPAQGQSDPIPDP